MLKEDKQILDLIAQTLYDKKGFNILVLDVRNISTMADYYIIAEGNVERHVKALARDLTDVLQNNGWQLFQSDATSADWIVLDFANIVVHLMTPELRERFALEELWRKANIVDVKIQVHPLKD